MENTIPIKSLREQRQYLADAQAVEAQTRARLAIALERATASLKAFNAAMGRTARESSGG